MQFKKVNSESVVQLVINSLTDAMLARELRPGDKLPTETELAESLGVGRNSIREAIKILVYLGVLEIRRAEGTFVCEGFTESMIDPMIYGIILDTSDSYENLMELREMMEVGVMQIAMEKYTEEEIKGLKVILDRMEREISKGPENVEEVFKADNEFHNAISMMGENPLIDKINRVAKTLTHAIRFNTVKTMLETGRGDELFAAHQRLYQIMVTKDQSDMSTTVRNTYFAKVGIKAIEEQ
ncbi:FadR/GntR family transcriptional regulator [Ohessyouella blattaphilus]|uniref:GntR family transcriptional regulator n=1 Tax=Ohessyouella blattaphilus TaxID=2949333 RepID=A0ABT1EKU8_9FIRM|nr:GntR family transcriptional regulator [Ohessyouella blattaphilus]MCP1111330.1 GntR family transcriptional regulator [Ohessyouella blattaphilus]MCR8564724.1 GntR family transcriptional regulator [Ohessyouella blattaphilus]